MVLKPKRPISVWIAQIILGIYSVGIALILLWGFYRGLTEGITNPGLYLITTVGVLTFVAVFAGGVLGMAKRKPWGRWLGVTGLAILSVGAAINQTMQWASETGGTSKFFSISFLFSVFVVIGLAFLVYLVAAGDASEEFFNGRSTEVAGSEVREEPDTQR